MVQKNLSNDKTDGKVRGRGRPRSKISRSSDPSDYGEETEQFRKLIERVDNKIDLDSISKKKSIKEQSKELKKKLSEASEGSRQKKSFKNLKKMFKGKIFDKIMKKENRDKIDSLGVPEFESFFEQEKLNFDKVGKIKLSGKGKDKRVNFFDINTGRFLKRPKLSELKEIKR